MTRERMFFYNPNNNNGLSCGMFGFKSEESLFFCQLMFAKSKKFKKTEKTSKKGVDNLGMVWYSIQALRARG